MNRGTFVPALRHVPFRERPKLISNLTLRGRHDGLASLCVCSDLPRALRAYFHSDRTGEDIVTFRVGQKVVLVGWAQDAVSSWRAIGACYPDVGDVYTVRAVKPWKKSAILLLSEIDNSHLRYALEPGFRQEFFRPIVERKTDLSIFQKMLAPTGVDA